MKLVLDTGALIALERNDRAMWRRLKLALRSNRAPISHGGVVGQAWRGTGPRQALLARAFAAIEIRGLDEPLGRATGELLARAKRSDVVDAALVLLANDGDQIVTSDPDDIEPLVRAADRDVEIIAV
jgi:hypothetical protein